MRELSATLSATLIILLQWTSALVAAPSNQLPQEPAAENFPESVGVTPPPPRPLPGLRTPIIWVPEDHEFEAKELWLHLVACQSVLASYGQDRKMIETDIFPLVISKGAIAVQPNHHATYGVMVWALLVIGVQMAQRYPMPQAIPTLSTIVGAEGMLVGHIRTQKPEIGIAATAPTSQKGESENSTSISARRRDANNVPLKTADTGSIPCYEDPNLLIHYRVTKRAIGASQVFTAFLMGNVFCSAYEGKHVGDPSIRAFSSDRRVSIHLTGVDFGPGVHGLTWRLMRIVLRELWQEVVMAFKNSQGAFVDEPRWESMSFLLEYGGVTIGQGSLG
ncbi:MAG: hypothetical protein Q9221_007484 [Calogaya cf. arnoldii]